MARYTFVPAWASPRPIFKTFAGHGDRRDSILAAETRISIKNLVERNAIGEVIEQDIDRDAGPLNTGLRPMTWDPN